jgi:hypothetical protein
MGPSSVLRFQEAYIIKNIFPKIGNKYQEYDMVHAFIWLDNNLFYRGRRDKITIILGAGQEIFTVIQKSMNTIFYRNSIIQHFTQFIVLSGTHHDGGMNLAMG